MKQITLRFPEAGYEQLLKRCERYGLSIRSFFEAGTLVALEDEFDPDHQDQQAVIWRVAARLECSEAFRTKPQHRLVISLPDDVHLRLQEACRRYGVTMNAALALLVTPTWPEEGPGIRYRQENLNRIVERARRLDFIRGPARKSAGHH